MNKMKSKTFLEKYRPKKVPLKLKSQKTNKQETKLEKLPEFRVLTNNKLVKLHSNSSPAPRNGVIEKEIERCATWKCKTKLIIKDKFCMICPKCNREYWRRKWITK